MADLSDVSKGLVSAIAGILFPGAYDPGSDETSVLAWQAPVRGTMTDCRTIRLYWGFPSANDITGELVAGKVHVSVSAEAGTTKLTTRFEQRWRRGPPRIPTLAAGLVGEVVTFTGEASATQVVGILVNHGPSAGSYAYRCTPADTPQSVAATLAAAIAGASASGAALTLAGEDILARVVCDQAATMEVRRQQQGFRIACWAPTPQARETVAGAVDAGLAGTPWLTLADGSLGRLIYRATETDDLPGKDRLWRRDLSYTIEYPTLLSKMQPVMLFPGATLNGGGAVMVPVTGNVLAGPAPIPGLTVSGGKLAVTVSKTF